VGFYKVWILHLGRRYGILQFLSKMTGPMPVAEISRTLFLSEQAVTLWCDAAYSVGLVKREGAGYVLPRRLVPLFVDENDIRFIGGLPSYLALRSLDFEHFDQFFRKGQITKVQTHAGEAFMEGTLWDHIAFLKLILPKEIKLQRLLCTGVRVIDVGAGSGGWSIKMAGLYPNSSFLGIDPDSSAITRATLRAAGLGLTNAKFSVIGANEAEYPKGFDLAYIGEVLYLVRERMKILQSCYAALRKGGLLVVCEGFTDRGPGARRSEDQLVHSMQLDFALQGGMFFTKEELAKLLSMTGFTGTRFHNVGGGLWFAIAHKK